MLEFFTTDMDTDADSVFFTPLLASTAMSSYNVQHIGHNEFHTILVFHAL